MRTVPVVIESVQGHDISVMLIETEGDDNAAITEAAQKVIADYSEAELGLGEMEMSEIEGDHTPWTVAWVQNDGGRLEKLTVAQPWE